MAFAGINYTMHDCEENQAIQIEKMRTVIIKGTDLLVVNIVTTGYEEATMNVLDLARQDNLPIIFFNREVSDSVISSYDNAVFVGTDADEASLM